ncbi:MAG: hypothetical protein RL701_7108, partial [Pseudomonadota bacterium]
SEPHVTPKIQSFSDFWPDYVGAHKSPRNRAIPYGGTTCAVGCVVAGIVTQTPWLLLAAPVVGYGPAWFGHFVIEGNKPATFGYARYSLLGDFKMLGLALRRRMGAEVERTAGKPAQA